MRCSFLALLISVFCLELLCWTASPSNWGGLLGDLSWSVSATSYSWWAKHFNGVLQGQSSENTRLSWSWCPNQQRMHVQELYTHIQGWVLCSKSLQGNKIETKAAPCLWTSWWRMMAVTLPPLTQPKCPLQCQEPHWSVQGGVCHSIVSLVSAALCVHWKGDTVKV